MMKIMIDINLACADEVISKDDEYDKERFFFFLLMYHILLLFEFD